MDLGFIGLGRMGANMVRRLLLDKHHIVAYNRTAEKTREIMTEGADGAFTLEELVGKLEKPRAVWVMVPSGDATESMIDELLKLLEPGDTIIDGGNSNFHDSPRHAKAARQGVNFIDAGTSRAASGASRSATA
jgi:6-phosphogluconate dehydrogenase